MNTETTDQPVLRKTPSGWLALSPGTFPRIGVTGATVDEAVENYRTSCERWRQYQEMAADVQGHAD